MATAQAPAETPVEVDPEVARLTVIADAKKNYNLDLLENTGRYLQVFNDMQTSTDPRYGRPLSQCVVNYSSLYLVSLTILAVIDELVRKLFNVRDRKLVEAFYKMSFTIPGKQGKEVVFSLASMAATVIDLHDDYIDDDGTAHPAVSEYVDYRYRIPRYEWNNSLSKEENQKARDDFVNTQHFGRDGPCQLGQKQTNLAVLGRVFMKMVRDSTSRMFNRNSTPDDWSSSIAEYHIKSAKGVVVARSDPSFIGFAETLLDLYNIARWFEAPEIEGIFEEVVTAAFVAGHAERESKHGGPVQKVHRKTFDIIKPAVKSRATANTFALLANSDSAEGSDAESFVSSSASGTSPLVESVVVAPAVEPNGDNSGEGFTEVVGKKSERDNKPRHKKNKLPSRRGNVASVDPSSTIKEVSG